MRVSIFTDSFLPFTSGVTFSVLNQASELAKRGHEISIFRPRPGRRTPKFELPDRVQVFDVPFAIPVPRVPQLRITLPSILSSWLRLRKLDPDIVHLNTEWGCGWEGMIASRILRKPTVGTFHTFFADPGYLKSFGLPTFGPLQSLMWGYSVFFFNSCRAVTSPSLAVKQSLLDHGLRREPIVIPNGIPLLQPIDWKAVKRARNRWQIHGPSFVYVGRLSPEKSLEIVLQAFAIVQRRRRRAKFIVIGDGPSRESLQSLASELGLRSSVEFVGHIDHEQLIEERWPLLGDTFVTASKSENQPMSILEAMALGLPVIGAAAKGLPELIAHEHNGLLFPPDDVPGLARCMLQIAAKTKRRRRMGRNAMLTAAGFRMPAIADRLEALYAHTIAQAKAGAPANASSLLRTGLRNRS
jgi:glycosyltransferase involved in cell wall biosynthesis